MMPPSHSDPNGSRDGKLRPRDWFLFPIIIVSTVFLVAVSAEMMARWLYPVSQIGLERCFVLNDNTGDAPVRPHGSCSERTLESTGPVEYSFNAHGDRAGMELKPKEPGVYRIVMIGSSMAMGLYVPRESSFAALLPPALSRTARYRVELYNAATGGKFRGGAFPGKQSLEKVTDVLSDRPDMILWAVTPKDFQNAGAESEELPGRSAAAEERPAGPPRTQAESTWQKLRNKILTGNVQGALESRIKATRTFLVLNHLLIAHESQDQYLTSYLKNEDDAGFLLSNPGQKWQHNIEAFSSYAAQLANLANVAGIPFVAVLIPNRAEAAMISRGAWPSGYDPFALGEALRSIIEGHGGIYIDILGDFRLVPNPERHYFAVDGHLDDKGHAMIAGMLEYELGKGEIPAFRASAELPPSALDEL